MISKLNQIDIRDIGKLFQFKPRPRKTAVSICISPNFVEIVKLKREKDGISVVNSISKKISKKELTGEKIKQILASEGITDKDVTASVPEDAVILRRFVMPLISSQERSNAILFEAKKHIPFKIDEVVSSFHVLKEDPAGNTMEVIFVAVKKDEIDFIVTVLKEAGLGIISIQPGFMGLIESLIISGNLAASSPPAVILHFAGQSKAYMIVVENGIPYLSRDISLFREVGSLENQIQSELKLFASYYKRELPNKNIAKLIITGLNETPSWLASLQTQLGVPVEQAVPLKNLTGKEFPERQMEISLGLAALLVTPLDIKINLLPKAHARTIIDVKKYLFIEIAAGLCILGLVYFSGIPSVVNLHMQISAADKAKTPCSELSLAGASIGNLNTTLGTWRNRNTILVSFLTNRINWYQKLQRFLHLIPHESWLTSLSYKDIAGTFGERELIIKGNTYTSDYMKEIEITNDFFKALKQDPVFINGFQDIKLGTTRKTIIKEYEVVEFTVSTDKEMAVSAQTPEFIDDFGMNFPMPE